MRIAQWNANGLQQHKEVVKLFQNQNQIDILLISETHFTSKNHFTIPGCDLYYTSHPDGTAHGGTAIIIKNTIAYYVQLTICRTSNSSHISTSQRATARYNYSCSILPTAAQFKSGALRSILPNSRPELLTAKIRSRDQD